MLEHVDQRIPQQFEVFVAENPVFSANGAEIKPWATLQPVRDDMFCVPWCS